MCEHLDLEPVTWDGLMAYVVCLQCNEPLSLAWLDERIEEEKEEAE